MDLSKIDLTKNKKIEIMNMVFGIAKQAVGKTEPGPIVGAIITDNKGNVLGDGYYQFYKADHAEQQVFGNISEYPPDAILFVNLEPCFVRINKQSCVDLILEKKIKNVIYGCLDENPKINGAGIKKLRAAGVICELSTLSEQAKFLNRVFFKHIKDNEAFLAVKVATSLDGKIALSNGGSKYLSGEKARDKVAYLRNFYQGIMVGSSTINNDDPSLNSYINFRSPVKIILAKQGKINDHAKFLADNSTRKIIFGCNVDKQKLKFWARHKVEYIDYPASNEYSFVNFKKQLYQLGIYSCLLEGGSTIISNALHYGAIDALHHFITPQFIGNDGIPFIGNLNLSNLADLTKMQLIESEVLGMDVLNTYTRYKKDN